MMDVLPYRTFLEWIEYDKLDPIGLDRGDLHAAIVASEVANVLRDKNHKTKASDFMPKFGQRIARAVKPATQLWSIVKGMAQAGIGTITNGKSSSKSKR